MNFSSKNTNCYANLEKKNQKWECPRKVGGANIAGLATPSNSNKRRIPAGIIPSYMAVFEFRKLKRLILSGKDVKIRQNCKKEAISTFFLLTFYNCKLQWDEINSDATFKFSWYSWNFYYLALNSNLQNFVKMSRCIMSRMHFQNIFQLIVQTISYLLFVPISPYIKNTRFCYRSLNFIPYFVM